MTHSFSTRRPSDLASHTSCAWAECVKPAGSRKRFNSPRPSRNQNSHHAIFALFGLIALCLRHGTKRARIRTMFQINARRVSDARSEEHTSELQSLIRYSYAFFCLQKKTNNK